MSEPYSEIQKRLTKESVFTALIKLLSQKSYQKISITEITKVAGVSRAAFYRNYTFKDDIIIYYFQEIFKSLLDELAAIESPDKRKRTQVYFTFFKAHKAPLKVLIKSDLTFLFYEDFCASVTTFFKTQTTKFEDSVQNHSALNAHYLPDFIASGLFRVLIEWVKNDTADSIDDLTQFIVSITGE